MFRIFNLDVNLQKKKIIHNLNLLVDPGTIHAIMGPNGSGKSTLAYTIAGHPDYCITNGSITFNGMNIVSLSPDKRAQLGIFLAFQHPYALAGVRVLSFLHESYQAIKGTPCAVAEFEQLVQKYMRQLHMDPAFINRMVNEGFSGGEKKRFEILQLLVLQPKLVILDEIDSGLDVDALKIVADGLQWARQNNPTMSMLMITHYQRILEYIKPDRVHVLCDGTIVQSGDTCLIDTLQRGYNVYRCP
ncbi:MAG: Fe-S cluster assembly ATPase SufC [bacterium]|nr:Fe-S cluster assembly ATPase SufC [bacterium]